MKIAGEAVLNAPVERVWDAILDPAVLVRTIPGCERLESTGENAYAMTVTAGVASIKGTYAGVCTLSDLHVNESLLMRAEGSGAPGTIGVDVRVGFADLGDGTTKLTYDADAVVGGMVGGVGQRMLTSVSKRMAGTFFSSVNDVLSGVETAPAPVTSADSESATSTPGQSFVAPTRATGPASPEEFIKGVAVGAALVLVGVAAGALAGRRRG
ncbi:SRPBCC family protein [Aeromicrobium sp. CF3.5]|uniref:SRPBCC family protein n=1 Tax=Aeromicrobium sp. CF3.5 TaxID=3373078 RepID=UPI003EE5BB04